MVTKVKNWVINLDATKHVYGDWSAFTFYIPVGEGKRTCFYE